VKLRVNKLPTISVVYTHGLDEPVRTCGFFSLIALILLQRSQFHICPFFLFGSFHAVNVIERRVVA
jgi:hypothetical protein